MKRASSREIAICGWNAVTAALEVHPERVRRLFFNARVGRGLGRHCRRLAAEKKVYRQVDDAELERVGGTVHHGGVVAIAEVPALRAPRSEELKEWALARQSMILLDGVANSHNVGALARTAAFFGISRLVLGGPGDQAVIPAVAYRVAEGGLEHLECYSVRDLAAFCREAGAWFRVAGTASEGAEPLPEPDIPRGWKEPVALVLGNEETGMSRAVREACRHVFRIPGSGRVESLNVAAAGAVLMYWLFHDARR